MDILEAIVDINLSLNSKIINDLSNKDFFLELTNFIDYKATKKMQIGSNDSLVVNEEIRNVNGYTLTSGKISDKIYFKHIQTIINYSYAIYKAKFPFLKTKNLDQIDLLKYSIGGKYEKHIDYFNGSNRTISFILNLNENYSGGDFIFYDQLGNEIKRIKCQTGTVILFPSYFLYPHSVEPITKGNRYSVVAWIR